MLLLTLDIQLVAAPQGNLADSLQRWRRLVCDPRHTLDVAGAMRPFLLQLISALVEGPAVQQGKPPVTSS
jgi:hypothetical protein